MIYKVPIKGFLRLAVWVSILAFGFKYLMDKGAVPRNLNEINALSLVTLSILYIVSNVALALRLKLMVMALGNRISLVHSFGLCAFGSLLNYFPFRAGLAVRAYYLNRLIGFSYSKYAACVFFNEVSMALVAVFIGTVIVAANGLGVTYLTRMVIVVAGAITTIIGGYVLFARRAGATGKIGVLRNIREGRQVLSKRPILAISLSILNAILIVVYGFRILVAARTVSIELSGIEAFAASALICATLPIYLTPAGIGLKEGTGGIVTKLTGKGGSAGIVPIAIERTVSFIWIAFFGLLYQVIVARRIAFGKSENFKSTPFRSGEDNWEGLEKSFSQKYPHAQSDISRKMKGIKIKAILTDAIPEIDWTKIKGLDIGCGKGVITAILNDKNSGFVGMDVDCEALTLAQRNQQNGNVDFVRGSGCMIPFKDGSFDVVVCNHVYEHVPNPKMLFDEIWRILKSNGVCYVAAANALFPVEPHLKLPFVHWLPRPLTQALCKHAGGYSEKLLSPFGLKKIMVRFKTLDYSVNLIKNPGRYHATGDIPFSGLLRRIPRNILSILNIFNQTLIWVLYKGEAGAISSGKIRRR